MFKKLTCNRKWCIESRWHNDGHNQEERLPTGVEEEDVAAEEPITSDGTFADKPILTWVGEVTE